MKKQAIWLGSLLISMLFLAFFVGCITVEEAPKSEPSQAVTASSEPEPGKYYIFKVKLGEEADVLQWVRPYGTGNPEPLSEMKAREVLPDFMFAADVVLSDGRRIQANCVRLPSDDTETYFLGVPFYKDAKRIYISYTSTGQPTSRKLLEEQIDEAKPPVVPPEDGKAEARRWWVYLLSASLAVAVGIIIYLAVRRRATRPPLLPPKPISIPRTKARLITPGNIEIPLTGESRYIGRGELARAVDAPSLIFISRQHLAIGFLNGQFYVEDSNSMNGTKLNGVEIKGRGKHPLNDDDIIEVGGMVALNFKMG